jgi:catechol 2,3-dioxygenase-like lactoylglutathione lyase family enzyme
MSESTTATLQEPDTSAAAPAEKVNPALKLRFLSHGTIECRDTDKSRKFYEEFLGLEVVRTSHKSLMLRLGGQHTLACVRTANDLKKTVYSHNGLDVLTREEVDAAYRTTLDQREKWGITDIMQPADLHGTYSFYFRDLDGNWWEILTNPEGGYSWMFSKGADIKNWGWDEDAGFNPNDSKPASRGGVRPKGLVKG